MITKIKNATSYTAKGGAETIASKPTNSETWAGRKLTGIVSLVILIMIGLGSYAQTNHYIGINNPGVYHFNYSKFDFIGKRYYQQNPLFIPSINYAIKKGKNGIDASVIFISLDIGYFDADSNVFSEMQSNLLCLSFLREIYNTTNAEINLLLGVASKYSRDEIGEHVGWGNGHHGGAYVFLKNTNEFGGLASNIGLNAKYRLYKRLYGNLTIRSVNFLFGADYQTHGIYTELGIGLKLGKL